MVGRVAVREQGREFRNPVFDQGAYACEDDLRWYPCRFAVSQHELTMNVDVADRPMVERVDEVA